MTLATLLVVTLVTVLALSALSRRADLRRAKRNALPQTPLHDSLTGLPNRVWFQSRLEQVLARVRRHGDVAAVLVLDVDKFSAINNGMGHEWGDAVLEQVARRLEELARTEDTVARMDGDQFVVLLEQFEDANSPARVAQRIIENFRAPLRPLGTELLVSLSIGVAVHISGETSAHALLRDASLALKRAKHHGPGRFEIFDAQLGYQAVDRLVLEAELRDALTEQELVVHYQPVVVLETLEIVGAEALVRWRHPTKGLLAPEQFIAAAEAAGLIAPIDRWVMGQACRMAAGLERGGLMDPRFRVNVNVSVLQLQSDRDFLEQTSVVLAGSGLAPERLVIEVTETIQGIEPFATALQQLRLMGVGVAVDDFGTGYSSLLRLRSLPVNIVKIDQVFVRGITDPANFAIVRAIVELAGVLGMDVIAEGIETPKQLQLVRSAGCHRGQGNFFSCAVPEERLEVMLRSGLPTTVGSRNPSSVW